MENLQWIFSGIGTEILSLIVGAVVGGLVGYKIGVTQNGRQRQKAKSSSKQRQELDMEAGKAPQSKEKGAVKNTIRQTQTAGDNSEQIQIGRIHDGK